MTQTPNWTMSPLTPTPTFDVPSSADALGIDVTAIPADVDSVTACVIFSNATAPALRVTVASYDTDAYSCIMVLNLLYHSPQRRC